MWGLMFKEVSIKGSMAYDDRDFKETVAAFVEGELKVSRSWGSTDSINLEGKFPGVERMVTSRIHLDDVPKKGFEELVNNMAEHVKILVTPNRKLLV
jgi:threonine dehydrogenase-like Zn-dependent dehydrogenase